MKRALICSIVLLFAGQLIAQDAPQMFSVLEVKVRPSKNVAYREGVKKLKAACELHKFPTAWNAFVFDDNSFVYTVPIKNMAELDKQFFAELESKMGAANLGKVWAELDASTESSRSYVIETVPGLSYLAPVPPDQTWRSILSITPEAGKDADVLNNFKAWKAAYESKKVPHGFIVYRTGFGDEPRYLILSWAKDALEYETTIKKRNDLLGDQVGKLWTETQSLTKSIDSRNSWRSAELSYAPKVN